MRLGVGGTRGIAEEPPKDCRSCFGGDSEQYPLTAHIGWPGAAYSGRMGPVRYAVAQLAAGEGQALMFLGGQRSQMAGRAVF